jgi:predicted nucleic acid-binding protein
MKRLKIYFDTSVINFLFADDAPQLREATIEFFEDCVNTQKYDVYISDLVIAEIQATKANEKRTQLLEVIDNYPIQSVTEQNSTEIIKLANLYLNKGILPAKSNADAFHVAICVVNQIDILLTWNYKHLANINRKYKLKQVNLENNYLHPLEILTPFEVLDDEEI